MSSTPELVAPMDGVVGRLQSLMFSWEEIDGGADYYVLQIATDALFANIVTTVETTLLQAEVIFEAGMIYYWRVQSHDGATVATSSEVRDFSAPPFSPASIDSHVEDGLGRLLNQFKESDG